ncbi:DNA 3'-5' helicase [Candidatus Electronema halotolerans]
MRPLNPLTLPLRGQILIEASAGTGKTYTIALLFLRLLLEQELAVDEILVVTFTDAAVEELRDRIRKRIREALDVLEGGGPNDPLLHKLLDKAGRNEQTKVLLNDALTRMDEAAVRTIHSFCRRMLQEHAVESGAPFEMELIDSEAVLRTRIIEDFWRQQFYPAGESEAAWVQSQWQEPAALLAGLGGHLEREDVQCLPEISPETLARLEAESTRLFAKVRQHWQQQGEEIASLLRESKKLSRDNKKGYGLERLDSALAQMDRLAEAAESPWLLGKELELFTSSKILDSLQKRSKEAPPEHPFFDLFEQFWQMQEKLLNSRKIAVLVEARDYLRSELARRKQEQNQLGFDDLQTWLAKALGGPEGGELAWRIARRLPVILVDEFQDTDPLQYRIFNAIHAAARQKRRWRAGLFLIGDPKQAIYSFRGADIFTYIQARQDTPPHNRLTMMENHRSSPAMVAAVSRLFEHEAPFLFSKDKIDFPHVKAADKAGQKAFLVDGRPQPALTCLLLPEGQGKKGSQALSKEAAKELAARFCAQEIGSLLTAGQIGEAKIGDKPLSSGDIAVLVRTHVEAELVRRELHALGIASVSGDRDSVFSTQEAKQLRILLTSLSDLSDTSLMRTALAGDLFGWTAERIYDLNENDSAREQIMEAMNRYHKLWLEKGFLAMLQQLLSEQKTVSRLYAEPSGERMLTNFLHLAELLQEASKQRPGMDALLRWFIDQMQHPEGQAESQQLRLESDENLVKIVTIHKAKGMEYPLVFLPFLWSARVCDKDKPLTFHDPDDRLCLDLGSGNEEHLALAERERLAEDLRLLYVAVTRAAHACFFCWGWIKSMEDSALAYLLHSGEPSSAQLAADLARLGETLAVKAWPETFPPLPDLRSSETKESLQAKQFREHIDTTWRITSYSSLASRKEDSHTEQPDHDEAADEEEAALPAPDQGVFGFPKGAAAGTCLHNILERISFSDSSGHAEVIASQLARAGFADSWLPTVSEWMQEVLRSPLLPGLSLSCLQESARLNEMAFYFPLESLRLEQFNRVLHDFGHAPLPERSGTLHGLMTGFIDLIFCWQGKYYLADYKSNHLGSQPEDYRPERLTAAMNEHRYDLQYLIYTVALHRFLGQRLNGYSYEQHFGGVFYLFLRGMSFPSSPASGVFAALPPSALVERLDACCRKVVMPTGGQ